MVVKFLKQYNVNSDGFTSIEIPEVSTHYKFKKGRINFYLGEDVNNHGFHEIPKGVKKVLISSRSHSGRHTERSMKWE